MNKISSLIVLILLGSCNGNTGNQNQKSITVESLNFDFLLGKWKRVHEDEGKITFENWTKINDLEYKGFGFTMQESDTIWQEEIKLIKIDSNWRFEVKSPQETNPVVFVLTGQYNNEFVCENPEHDFPTLIKYWKDEQTLKAVVSSNEMEILFEFVEVD